MRTASPWWASLIFGIGLLLVLVGERLFGAFPGPRLVMTVLGVLGVLGITALRAYTTAATQGARRRVERTLLVCQIGVIVALVLYTLTTSWGIGHMSLSEKSADKASTVLTVLWTIAMIVSIVPMFMIEMSLGGALRNKFELASASDEGIEYLRVRDVGWSGLSVALAGAFLLVTCNVANERNVQRDVSYYKTSSPGDSSIAIVQTSPDPIKVLLFFPDPNEVKDQIKDYFQTLASKGGKLELEEHDRLVDAELAGKYKVTKDGMIVLVRGTGDKEKSGTIELDTDLQKARQGGGKLRNFDREVNKTLRQITMDKRKAYITKGHGEMNDYESVPAELKGKVLERHTTLLKKELGQLGYDVKDLGLIDLVKDVPDDATVVIVLGPTTPLEPAEWAALDRYLDRGGRLLLALDPLGEPGMGPLEAKLGLKFNPGHLQDDQLYLPQRGGPSDKRFVITDQFSAHASVTALSRSVDKGLVFIDSGALEDAPGAAKDVKKTITIHSRDTSYLDLNDNFAYDPPAEKKQKWNLAAAVEGPKMKDKDGKDKDGWRVLVFADTNLFTEALVQSMGRVAAVLVSGPLLDNSVDWLGGKEAIAGDVVSEDDKKIQHTKGQDAVWFTVTIVGAPVFVLALGLIATWARKRRSTKSVEVKP